MQWVDLSAIGLCMGSWAHPTDPAKSLPLAMVDSTGQHDAAIRSLGFRPMVGIKASGIYVRPEKTLTSAMLINAFGRENVRFVKGPERHFHDEFQRKFRERSNLNATAMLSQSRAIGLNHKREVVFEAPLGRYVIRDVGGRKSVVSEEEQGGADFLRVDTREDLRQVASGFVSRITVRNEQLRRENVQALMEISNRGQFTPRDYQEAIEIELNVLLKGELQSAGQAASADPLAAYDVAEKIYRGMPDLRERTPNSVANQQYSTPAPMSAIAQAVLTRGEPTAGRTFLDPTIGNASLYSTIAGERTPGTPDRLFGVEIDPVRVDAAMAIADAVALGDATTVDFRAEFNQPEGFDYVIANPPFGSMDTRVEVSLPAGSAVDSMQIRRLDHFLLLKSLHARKDIGRAVFITGADNVMKPGEILGASKHLLAYLYDHYAVESVVDVSGDLYKKQGAAYPLRIYVVGARRPEPIEAEIPGQLPIIRSYEGLRAWAVKLLAQAPESVHSATEHASSAQEAVASASSGTAKGAPRPAPATVPRQAETKSAEAPIVNADVEPALAPPVPSVVAPAAAATAKREDTREESEYQQRYVAFSNVGEATAMIPANLSGPVYEALSEIREQYGDIDEYVAKELQYPLEDLGKYFSPEQVDAVAMVCAATNKGLGFLLADQMGIGKGRVIAASARREKLAGRIPVFVTLTDNLFSDFMERDLVALDSRHLFENPLIINDGAKTVDATGKVVARALSRPKYVAAAETGRLPEGTDIVLLTYSQINRRPESHRTTRYMHAITANEPVSLLLDESHIGAGSGNTSENLGRMIDNLSAHGGNVLYSSGTPIKGAKNLALYKRILPAGVNPQELLDAVASDPISLQEAFTYEVAAQGCLISRELDNSGLEKEFVLSRYAERNEKIADQMSDILSAMNFIAGDVGKIVTQLNREMAKELEAVPEAERVGQRMGATSMNFPSRMHALMCQMLLSLKAPEIVDLAIEALEANEKPIIAVQRTGESMLADILEERHELAQSEDGAVKKDLGDVILDRPITFKDYLHRTLERILWVSTVNRYGNKNTFRADSKEMRSAEKRLRELIDELPDDLPLTPIDYITEELEKRGYSSGEISGRNLRTRTLDDGRVIIEAIPGKTDKTRANRAVREFNNGDLDALILTVSGAVGYSMQASPAVGSDVRQRTMIKGEMQADIAMERQMDGRPNRTGQISKPKYKIPQTGLPADDRGLMMFNSKNRSLTASTVANRDSADLVREVPDLLNSVGDMVALDLLEEDPELAHRLDIDMREDTDVFHRQPLYYIKVLTGRICLLKVSEQRAIYADLEARFHEKVDRLKAEGRNPLEVVCHEWRAKVVSRAPFMGGEVGGKAKRSQFNSPVYLTVVEYSEEQKAVRADAIDKRIAMAVAAGSPNPSGIASYLQEHRADILQRHTPKRFESVQQALEDKEPNEAKTTLAKLDWLERNLASLQPGAVFQQRDLEGNNVETVVLRVSLPNKLEAYLRLSEYVVYTMKPGSDVVTMETASSLFANAIDLSKQRFAQHRQAREDFDSARNGTVLRRARLLDGNLFEATSLNLRQRVGRKVVYTDETGARQHGILVYSDISDKALASIPERVRDPALVIAMSRLRPFTTDPSGDYREDGGVKLRMGRVGQIELSVPGAKKWGGKVFTDPVLTPIDGQKEKCRFNLEFRTSGDRMLATVPVGREEELAQYLIEGHGYTFYTVERAELLKARASLDREREPAMAAA